MPSALSVADDIVAAGTALAGLLLVFIGFALTSFEQYAPQERNAVRIRYLRRIWLAFAGFALAVLAVLFALAGRWLTIDCLGFTGLVLFVLALIVALTGALLSALEIR